MHQKENEMHEYTGLDLNTEASSSLLLNYATVQDYCGLYDRFQTLATHQNDLKDVQRPWAVAALGDVMPSPARVQEVGGGEPLAASVMASLGYTVTLCDPFDGSGHGPTHYEACRKQYPAVAFRRMRYTPDVARQDLDQPFDAICSISVLEHVKGPDLDELFEAIQIGLRQGGASIHCMDVVVDCHGENYHLDQLARILRHQVGLAGSSISESEALSHVNAMCVRCLEDLETFFLSPQGHNLWRGATPYVDFPFRKVISAQSVVLKA